MNIKKPLLVAGVVSSVGLASVTGLGVVSAANSTTASDDGQTSLINKIASKFNLNKDQVKAVFDSDRTERDAARQKEVETALTQAVTAGKITSAQKDLILAKRAELKTQMDANRDTMKNKTDAERKAAMDAEQTALKKWATDNNIPSDYLKYVMGGPGGGPGGPGGHGPDGSTSSTSTSSSTSQ